MIKINLIDDRLNNLSKTRMDALKSESYPKQQIMSSFMRLNYQQKEVRQMKKKLSPIGQVQAGRVMKEFAKGKLRDTGGHPITSPEQAKAVGMSEGRRAEEMGTEKRMFKGRSRIRPKLKGE